MSEEFGKQTIHLANCILSLLRNISSTETASSLVATLPDMLNSLKEINTLVNMYIDDDDEGAKEMIEAIILKFTQLNEEFAKEIERIQAAHYYGNAKLESWIKTINYPILSLPLPRCQDDTSA